MALFMTIKTPCFILSLLFGFNVTFNNFSVITRQCLVVTGSSVLTYMSRDMTKPTNWVCAQRRLRSAWASAQSDQSSLSAWRNLGSLAVHWMHSKDSDQTGRMPRLIWVFAGHTVTLLVLSCRGSNSAHWGIMPQTLDMVPTPSHYPDQS